MKHAQQVCMAVLGTDASARVSISVFIARDEELPAHLPATHEYMIFINFSVIPQLLSKAHKDFMSFLGKDLFTHVIDNSHWLYWGEGESLNFVETQNNPAWMFNQDVSEETPVLDKARAKAWLKTDTILPNWLDRLLFESLGARHEPDWKKFEQNLELDANDIKVYLGTYFPRSYAEAFCIHDALFECKQYSTLWRNRTEAWLLDIGCGSGGNLIGLLTALAKHCPHLDTVHVHGFDGNALALDFAKIILDSFVFQTHFAVDFTFTVTRMNGIDDLPQPANDSYDFISSSKMGNEIISTTDCSSEGFYHRFLSRYIDYLSDIGLLILLDVTTKSKQANFYPQLLNDQVSRFVRAQPEFATLVPVPCYLYETRCLEFCFTQNEFSVSHSAFRNDLSRVAYRVLARKACAQKFHNTTEVDAKYIICRRTANNKSNVCVHSSDRGMLLDGYKTNT